MPYIKFLDLNENKIKNLNSIFFCPSLENLLLKDNNLTEENFNSTLEFCPKLKQIDLSFNKINNLSFIIKLINKNEYLENINIINNPFLSTNNNKNISKIFKNLCFNLKNFNNEEIINNNNKIFKRNKIFLELNKFHYDSYFNIFLFYLHFMKFFKSIYFVNKIFNIFNLNINSNLNEFNYKLIDILNLNFIIFKQIHLNLFNQNYKNNQIINIITFNNKNNNNFYNNNFQTELLLYLHSFKYKILFIKNSISLFSKNLTLRKIKIVKIQQQYKLRILRKKLAAIKIPDDEYDHADDLIDFFNKVEQFNNEKEHNFHWEKGKIEKLEEEFKNPVPIKISNEKIIKTSDGKNIIIKPGMHLKLGNKNNINNPTLETIHENQNEDIKDNINDDINNKILNDNKNINVNDNKNINKNINNNNIKNNNIIINNNKKKIIEDQNDFPNKSISTNSNQEIFNLMKNLNNNPNNLMKMKKQLTPVVSSSANKKTLISQEFNNNMNNINFFEDPNTQTRYPYPKKYKQGDNIPLKIYNINNQILPSITKNNYKNYLPPIKRPDSNVSSHLTNNNNNNFNKMNNNFINNKNNNISTISDNDTRSLKSSSMTGFNVNSKFMNVKGRVLPKNIIDQIKLLEQQCKETIQKAKEEWGFTNPQTADLLAKKIFKKYKKKINNLLGYN